MPDTPPILDPRRHQSHRMRMRVGDRCFKAIELRKPFEIAACRKK